MRRAYQVAQLVACTLVAVAVMSDAPWETPESRERLFLACVCAFWLVAAEELR